MHLKEGEGNVISPVTDDLKGHGSPTSRPFADCRVQEGSWGQRLHLPPHSTLSFQVQVGDDDFVHIRVFKSLPHENKPLALSSYQTNKARHDELSYF